MSVSTITSDEQLVRMVRNCSKEGFSIFYQKYASYIYGMIKRSDTDELEAEDLFQQAILRIWTRIESYDPSRTGLSAWVFQITRGVLAGRDIEHTKNTSALGLLTAGYSREHAAQCMGIPAESLGVKLRAELMHFKPGKR